MEFTYKAFRKKYATLSLETYINVEKFFQRFVTVGEMKTYHNAGETKCF